MQLYATVKALFTAICDALRRKLGTSELIPHQDIPALIDAIPSGADTSDATALPELVGKGLTYYGPGGKQTGVGVHLEHYLLRYGWVEWEDPVIFGDLADIVGGIPPEHDELSVWGHAHVTGNISALGSLPAGVGEFAIGGLPLVEGDISVLGSLPAGVGGFELYNLPLVEGDISVLGSLPAGVGWFELYNLPLVEGDISVLGSLPAGVGGFAIGGLPLVEGDISVLGSLPEGVTGFLFSDLPLVEGDISVLGSLPEGVGWFELYNLPLVEGDISVLGSLPAGVGRVVCRNMPLVTGYFMPTETMWEIILFGAGMSAADTDQTLINLATVATNPGMIAVNPNRTTASDDAVDTLLGIGWEVIEGDPWGEEED